MGAGKVDINKGEKEKKRINCHLVYGASACIRYGNQTEK
jgi:hypothetical protein